MRIQLKLFLSIVLYLCTIIFVNGQETRKSYALEPIPSWVKNYPKPVLEEAYDTNLPLVHDETQYNHSTGELYIRLFYFLYSRNSVNKINSYSFEYEPDYESVSLHKVTIHRGQKKINLGNQLHVEFFQEGKQINGKNYDIDGKIKIFFDKTQTGDLLEIVYSKKGFQPDLHKSLFFDIYFTSDNLRGKNIFRVLSAKNKPFQFVTLNTSKKPTVKTRNGIMSLEYIHTSKDDPAELDTPIWYENYPKIHLTDLKSWKEYLDLNLMNFNLEKKPSSTIVQKVNTLIDTNTPKVQQINTILNYVQENINYLEYGKIKPKQPETVINQGFGDCKSKSLLAIKMLEAINVEAWPVIVKIDGLDNRLLELPDHLFDHCVLEFVHERDTILFDATRNLQRGTIYEKYNDDFRYGFRVKKGTTKLTKLKQNNYNSTNLEVIIRTLEKEDSFQNLISEKIVFNGETANNHITVYKKYGTERLISTIKDKVFNMYRIEDHFVNFTFEDNEPKAILKIDEYDSKIDIFKRDYDNNIDEFQPKPLINLLTLIDNNASTPIFSLPDFGKTTQVFKFIHPKGANVKKDSLRYEKDWIKFSKKVTHYGDTLIATYTAEILKKELNSNRYDDVRNDIDTIKKLTIITLDNPTQDRKYYNSLYIILINVIPFVFLGIIILIVVFIVKYVKRNRQVKKLKMEIASLKDELKQQQTE